MNWYKLTEEGKKGFEKFFDLEFKPLPKVEHEKVKGKDLCLADIHAPAHNDYALKKAVNDNLDCENVWIVGDLWDFYSKSFFRKRQEIPFRTEFRQGYYILQWLSANFENVYLQLANHDARFKKYMFDNVPVDLLNFVHSNILEEFIGYLPNVKILNQRIDGARTIEYLHQHENVLFTHAEVSGADISKAVQEVFKRMSKWHCTYSLNDYNAIIQAHNHQSAKLRVNKTTWLFQIPCLIDIGNEAFSYVFDGKMKGNPPSIGYMVLYFENGKLDPVKTHIVDL